MLVNNMKEITNLSKQREIISVYFSRKRKSSAVEYQRHLFVYLSYKFSIFLNVRNYTYGKLFVGCNIYERIKKFL